MKAIFKENRLFGILGALFLLYLLWLGLSRFSKQKVDSIKVSPTPEMGRTETISPIQSESAITPYVVYKTKNFHPKIFTGNFSGMEVDDNDFIKFSDNRISISFQYPVNWDTNVMTNGTFIPFNQEHGNVFQSIIKPNADSLCSGGFDCGSVGILYREGNDEDFAKAYDNSLCLKYTLNNINGCVYEFNEGGLIAEYFDFMDKNNKGRFSVYVSAKDISQELLSQILKMLSTLSFK